MAISGGVLLTVQDERRVDSQAIIDIIRGARAIDEYRNLSSSCGIVKDIITVTEHVDLSICELTQCACADAVDNDV